MRLGKFCVVSVIGLFGNIGLLMAKPAEIPFDTYKLEAFWSGIAERKPLAAWALGDLSQFKKVASHEKDPVTGKVVRWEGILLSKLMDKLLSGLSVENRAQIDLLLLQGANGEFAMIPRSLAIKYPVMLAFVSGEGRGPLYSVVPWTSKPGILSEGLPLGSYFVPQLRRIELTSYKERFSSLFLKRRTDPSAMRGEKLFVQNCVSCHSMEKGPAFASVTDQVRVQRLTTSGHPEVKGTGKLSGRDWQSIVRYLNAYHQEKSVSASVSVSVAVSVSGQ